MSMRTFDPLPEELLIAMYLLIGILKRCQKIEIRNKPGMPQEVCDALTGLWFSPLSDLLWGAVSWKKTDGLRENQNRFTDSYDRLMRMLFGSKIIRSCPFSLHHDPSCTELFEKKVIEGLKNWHTDTPSLAKGLTSVQAHFQVLQKERRLSLQGSDARRLVNALFSGYHATMVELRKVAKEKGETNVHASVRESMLHCRFLDPEKIFLDNHKAVYKFLCRYLNDYLQAFVERDRIDWDLGTTLNLWKWPKQRQCALEYLRKQQEDCGDGFFYSPAAAAFPDEAKPIETLFALVGQHAIDISEIKQNDNEWRIEFKVSILEQSEADKAKVPETKAFDFMGTRTVDDTLSNVANAARCVRMKHGKQRYLWQYLRTTYGSEPQPLSTVEQYVSQKLSRKITITKKDFEGHLELEWVTSERTEHQSIRFP